MRVIFTDIDGVLNPHWRTKWSKKSIDIYNRLCSDFDLTPVITSTWKTNHTIERLQEIFDEQGIIPRIYDYTPHLDQQDRGLEIKTWLEENRDKVTDYVVIDDKTSNIEPYVNNVVKCQSWVGLIEEQYQDIKKILGE